MKFVDFKSSLSGGEEYSVYLIEGEDAYFRSSAIDAIKNKFVDAPEINFVNYEGENFSYGELETSLFSLPFMSPKRLTAIREFYPKEEGIKGGLKDFLKNPPKDSVLLIINEKPCESIKKYSSVCVVECDKADSVTLSKWIITYLKRSDINISFECARSLAEFCRCDMTRIKNETEKLACFVGNGGYVTEDVISENVYRDAEYKIYEMTDFIAKKNFSSAIAVVNDMLYKGEAPQKIIISVYNYFRRLLFVKISDLSEAELSGALGIKEFAVRKAKEQAGKLSAKSLKNAIDELSDADYKIKIGKVGEFNAMWLNVFKILTAV